MLGRPMPAIERIPKTARIHSANNTPAICLNGEGKIVIAPATSNNTRRFQRVTSTPLMVKNLMSGKTIPLIFT